jgi:hypothetical protein
MGGFFAKKFCLTTLAWLRAASTHLRFHVIIIAVFEVNAA